MGREDWEKLNDSCTVGDDGCRDDVRGIHSTTAPSRVKRRESLVDRCM